MSVAVKEGQDARQLVRDLVKKMGHEKAELIPILHEINGALGYISDDAIQELSEQLKMSHQPHLFGSDLLPDAFNGTARPACDPVL